MDKFLIMGMPMVIQWHLVRFSVPPFHKMMNRNFPIAWDLLLAN